MRKRSVGFLLVVGGVALTTGVGLSMVRTGDGTLSGDPSAVESALLSPPATIAAATGALVGAPVTESSVPEVQVVASPRIASPAPPATGPTAARQQAPTTSSPPAIGDLAQVRSVLEREPRNLPAPSRLIIGALDVAAPVGAYGVDADGQMDVPDNVMDVGWYQFGPTPGSVGSAVLAAHVDLAGQGPGVFFNLSDLRRGDVVTVEYEDDSATTFRVVANTIYDKDELPTEAIFSRSGPPVLTLITCGGGFSRSSRSYDSNVVVYAVPLTVGSVPAPGPR